MKVRLTAPADRDVSDILSEIYRLFGANQTVRYAAIIDAGVNLIADEPNPAASKARTDIGSGVRSFHLQLATKRQGGASHVIYYRVYDQPDGARKLVVLRVLADRMEPRRRVARSLRTDET